MYNRMNKGYDCNRLSHLIYRLHRSLDYKTKFLLVTRIFDFNNDLAKSEEVSRRLLTSVDPEFIYLLLRSSTIFQIIGLEISNLLMCNKKNAKHMRKIVVYVTEILETNRNRNDFIYDTSTKAITEHMEQYDIVWMRLIYQSLSCLERISEYMGCDYIYSYFTYVNELNESIEYLLNDMFDVSLQTEGGLEGSGLNSISTKSDYFSNIGDFSCELCEFLRKNEFKDEAIKLEEVYEDLDSLAKAHLEELDMEEIEDDNDSEYETENEDIKQNKEDKENVKEYKDYNKSRLLNVLEELGDSFLEELRENNKDVCVYLSCIVILFKILPSENRLKFVKKCLETNNFDVIKTLLMRIQSLNSDNTYDTLNRVNTVNTSSLEYQRRDLDGLNDLLYRYCVELLDSNITRENIVCLLGFIKEHIENREYNSENKQNILDLIKITKRCEIEIYLSLEEVFRKEEILSSNIPFETMEIVMSVISNIEDPFDNMDEFFSVFHRTVQVLFDYFDHLYENKELNKSNTNTQVNKYKTCGIRLLSCWMTLESMYFQSKYLQKLPRILTVINDMDFIWLLPTFNYIEVSDLYSIELFLEKLVSVVYEVSKFDYYGEVSRNTIRMSCELLMRIHLDPLVDYKRMLKIFSYGLNSSNRLYVNRDSSDNYDNKDREIEREHYLTNKFNLVDYKQYFEEKIDKKVFNEFNEYMNEASTFTPKCPLEYLVPICINLDESNNDSYKVMSSVLLELLFKMYRKTEIRFVKEFIEGSFNMKLLVDDISKEERYEKIEEFDLLVYVTLETVSSCMGRVYESNFVKNYGNELMVFLLSLTVFLFLHTSPRSSEEYLYEENELEKFYWHCRLSVLLMQNYPLFVKMFNYCVKKTGLKIAPPLKEDFEKIIEEGLANEEDLVLSELFSMYTYNL